MATGGAGLGVFLSSRRGQGAIIGFERIDLMHRPKQFRCFAAPFKAHNRNEIEVGFVKHRHGLFERCPRAKVNAL